MNAQKTIDGISEFGVFFLKSPLFFSDKSDLYFSKLELCKALWSCVGCDLTETIALSKGVKNNFTFFFCPNFTFCSIYHNRCILRHLAGSSNNNFSCRSYWGVNSETQFWPSMVHLMVWKTLKMALSGFFFLVSFIFLNIPLNFFLWYFYTSLL